MSEPGPNEPLPVNALVIGPGTGDGSIRKETIVTPYGHPNIVQTIITPTAAILIRFIKTYLVSVSGLIVAGAASQAIPATDFLDLVYKCAGLSLAGACIDLIKNLITLLGDWEKKFPLLGA